MKTQPDLEDKMLKILTKISQINSRLSEQQREEREVRMMGYLINLYGSEEAGRYFGHYKSGA